MGYGDHDDHVIWMNYVIPMASRIVMIYPWKIIPYHTNKGYWGRVSSIRHVNTLWCLSPESFLGFWGTWKNRLWSQTICPSSVMSCLFWDDDWSLRSWHPFYRWIFAANLTSVLFFMWTDQFLEKNQVGFCFSVPVSGSSNHLQPRMNWNSVLPSWTTSRSRLGNPLGTRAFKGKSMSWMGPFHQAMFDYHRKVL